MLEQVQRDLVALPGVGMSVMEISHRSTHVRGDHRHRPRPTSGALAGVPDSYKVLFLQGGASLQFSMVPMNLLTEGTTADYIITGAWAEKAVKEAKRVGAVHVTGSTEGATTSPASRPTPNASSRRARRYVHMTSNNTI